MDSEKGLGMKPGNCGLLLMLLAMGACSAGEPTAPQGAYVVAGDRQDQGVETVEKSGPSGPTLQLDRGRVEVTGMTPTQLTWKAANSVDRAAKAYAQDNDGWFPAGVSVRNAAGRNLIDYLPTGRLLVNAFTEARTEPSEGAAAYQGQVGYLAIHDNDGYPVGYVVSAIGINNEEALHIEHLPD